MRKYVITIIFLLLLAISVSAVFAPADMESIDLENREISTLPDLSFESAVSGEYASGFDKYINDNIAMRGRLITLSDKIQSYFGYTPDDLGQIVSTTKDIGTGEEHDAQLLVFDNKIMEMFWAQHDTEQEYASALNAIKKSLPQNIRMYSMLVPTQLEFCDRAYADAQDSQMDAINSVYSKLDNITSVDTYTPLWSEYRDDTYYMTDHHWTPDGAYLGYNAFAKISGFTPVSKSEFSVKEVGEFYGALYQKVKSEAADQPKDTMKYYDVEDKYSFKITMKTANGKKYDKNAAVFRPDLHKDYSIFFGGDQPFMEIKNNSVNNDNAIVVIKDSYANAMLPWLISSYKTTVVIDPRLYTPSLAKVVEEYKAKEVIVINYVFTTTFNDYCELLLKLSEN